MIHGIKAGVFTPITSWFRYGSRFYEGRRLNQVHTKTPIFRTLDGIRGVAALLVLVRHVPFFGTWDFQQSYLAVDLFFLLSGVVVANAYQKRLLHDLSPAQFVWMRIVRIYPLYLLGCAVTGLYWIVTGKWPQGNGLIIAISALLLIPNLSSRNNPFPLNGPAWSLFSEMLANILYAYFVRRLNHKVLLTIMGISAGWIMIILWRHGNLDIGYYTRDIVPGLCRVAYSFAAGVLLWKLFSARDLQRFGNIVGAKYVPWLLLTLVVLLLTASPSASHQAIFDFACVTLAFPALILVAMICNPGSVSAPFFAFLGLVSYPVYALHSPLSRWIPLVLRDTGADVSNHPLWIGIAFTAILVPLCWLIDKYIDMPIRRVALPVGFAYLRKIRAVTLVATSNKKAL
jgi:peptidoglycan/LPS O-acetylase OafA/YrhL